MPDKGTPFTGGPSVAKLELVGQPVDDRLALLGPGGKGEELGYRGRGITAGGLEKMAHELQRLSGLARPGGPHDEKLPTRLLVHGLDAQYVTVPGRGPLGELHQLRGAAHADVHLGGIPERALEVIHGPL
jgi:hypothetical protein